MTGVSPVSVSFRTYVPHDYDQLIRLWEEAGLPYKSAGRDRKDRIEQELLHGVGRIILAESQGVLVGAVLATHDGRKGWINRLAVLPRRRRSGIGRLLVEEAEAWLASRGIEIFTCLIETYNDPSMAFFGKLGYIRHDDIMYFSKRLHDDV
ncbi:GNAT family N-acetyltransferase [bacterium]|nr:GNAT family N-acetyltransferase [bacterium]